jgi:tRNA pseudouridine55 synthase
MSLFPYEPSGLFPVHKPSGPTSHDAVAWARRVFDTPAVGHCGTLDPLATGLLLLVMGDSLKLQNRFTDEKKVYSGSFRLGVRTDSHDLAGKSLQSGPADPSGVTEERLREAFAKHTGEIRQQVPLYSAVKVQGRKLYEWARKGLPVELPVKTVTVSRFDLAGYAPPEARFLISCSKGTYVRSLARDVGELLGTGAVLSSLSRDAIGSFRREDAYAWGGERDFRREDVLKAFIPHDRLEEMLGAR